MTRLLAGVALAALVALPSVAQETATEETVTENETTEATAAAAAAEDDMSSDAAMEDADAGTVLATVNGTDITVGHLIAMLELLPPQYRQLPDEVLYQGMLDQLVQQELMAGAARGEMTEAMELGLENESRAFLAASLANSIGGAEVTEEDLQAEYDARFADFEPVMEYNASHILLETADEAAALIEQLDGGADFAELARDNSIGPTAPDGGNLGWFSDGMMIDTFFEAVVALEVGAVTAEPVETQFGFHVIILNDTREQGPPPLEAVQAELEEEIRRDRVDARIAELIDAGEVDRPELDIDPAIIRNGTLLTE